MEITNKRCTGTLNKFIKYMNDHPDQRFFQFLINYTTMVNYREHDPWYYEDDELFKALQFRIKQIKKPKKTKERCSK